VTDHPVEEKTVVEKPVVEKPVVERHVVEEPRVVHDTVVEHEHDNGSPNWAVRLALGVGGIVLLLGALAAWQFQDRIGGQMAITLPWLIAGAVLLGAAAIVESITTEVWVTLLAGIFLLAAAFIVTGRVNVQLDASAHSVFVIDRFTGEVRLCNAMGCRDLPGFGGPSVNIDLQAPDLHPLPGKPHVDGH
jgi:hypothetical protein